jgi:hypothetical protein
MSVIDKLYVDAQQCLMERFTEQTGFMCTTTPNPDYALAQRIEWYAQAIAFWSRERDASVAANADANSNSNSNSSPNKKKKKPRVKHMVRTNICGAMLVDLGRDVRVKFTQEEQTQIRARYAVLMQK